MKELVISNDIDRLITICESVSADVENDAREFDGRAFDGKTVATYVGYHGAAIKALSDVMKAMLLQIKSTQK